MTMLKLIGSGLVILFGAAAGRNAGKRLTDRCRDLELTAELLRRLLMLLEYEQPTVDEMLSRTALPEGRLPLFIKAARGGRSALLTELRENRDELSVTDRDRLEELFTDLGSSDKAGEQQRLSAAEQYFRTRAESLRPEAESRSRLYRSLGLLGGVFAAVMLI